jgi:Transglutaminase-like superfamily
MSANNSPIRRVVFLTIAMSLALSYSAGPAPRTRIFHFDYQVAVENIPAGARHIDVWVPIPHGDAHQQITNLRVYAAYPSAMEQAADGNTMLHIGRDNPKEPFTVSISLDAHRQEHVQSRLSGGPRLERDADSLELAQYLHPDRLVPLHDHIRAMAREVVEKANARTDVEMARAIYDHVVSTVKYDKSGKGAGRGDIYYVSKERRGNCVDFDAIFVGYSRAVGIPARYAVGFALPVQRGEGKIPEYHCWAEFYAKGIGWVPVDATEAAQHPSNREYFFGAEDENRIELTNGRDLVLAPKQRGGALNYFIYPYAEVDGKEFDGVQYEVRYRDL